MTDLRTFETIDKLQALHEENRALERQIRMGRVPIKERADAARKILDNEVTISKLLQGRE